MRYWSVLVPADRYAAELPYSNETIELRDLTGVEGITEGDQVALIADIAPPVVFAVGTAVEAVGLTGQPLVVAYTRRLFDDPRPAADVAPRHADAHELTAAVFDLLTSAPGNARQTWLVSLDLPIEAETPAEAVRQFWTYVQELGPSELPTFVSPSDDELAMQAFVLGAVANLDPGPD